MPGLGVNIDHVATVRQARRTVEPDPVWAAVQAELGGADGITFHLRQDRRHIGDRDARLLCQVCKCKTNMEMSLTEEIVQIALEIKPGQATLVPENRQEITTEGGLDLVTNMPRFREVTKRLQDAGVIVSAFIDPDPRQIAVAAEIGCDAVELHTGQYANARPPDDVERTLTALRNGVRGGIKAGLVVHGGHGLTYNNIAPVAAIDGFTEFNIGHTIVSRALWVGMAEAVREMKRLIDRAARVLPLP
jgi:pyridoxine 5-phosphate synthase